MKISELQRSLYVTSALYCGPLELRSTFNIIKIIKDDIFSWLHKKLQWTFLILEWNGPLCKKSRLNKRIDGIGCRLKMSEDLYDKVF